MKNTALILVWCAFAIVMGGWVMWMPYEEARTMVWLLSGVFLVWVWMPGLIWRHENA